MLVVRFLVGPGGPGKRSGSLHGYGLAGIAGALFAIAAARTWAQTDEAIVEPPPVLVQEPAEPSQEPELLTQEEDSGYAELAPPMPADTAAEAAEAPAEADDAVAEPQLLENNLLESDPPGESPANADLSQSPTGGRAPSASRGRPESAPRHDVQPSSFRGVTPGVTTAVEAERILGEPRSKQTEQDSASDAALASEVWTYEQPPFERLVLTIDDQVVSSIVLHLASATPVARVVHELGLESFPPAVVYDDAHQPIGKVFPDRGVLLGLATGAPNKVRQIVLEPVSAEPFVLRVLQDKEFQYQRSLTDLECAEQLDDSDPRIFQLRAQILHAIGRHDEARQAAQRGCEPSPSPESELLLARLWRNSEELADSVAAVEAVLKTDGLAAHVRAQAECLLGDLYAAGDGCDPRQAFDKHLAAITIAAPLTQDASPSVRQCAKETLMAAHIGAALDIAAGDWKGPETAAPQWLSRASAHAEDLIKNEGYDPSLRMLVSQRSLAVYAALRGKVDAKAIASKAIVDGRGYIAQAADDLRKSELEWLLGAALCDAATNARDRQDLEASLKLADNALALLEQAGETRDDCPRENAWLGRLYYLIGANYAQEQQGHEAALRWYDKASVRLVSAVESDPPDSPSASADRLISMGVSYWRAGQYAKGKELTEEGARRLQDAVNSGRLPESALAICYGNLAIMYAHFDDHEQAQLFAENAALLRAAETSRR